ncbi:MAG: SDR family oxidoreductase [Streptosporangiales bacterium]|nr:SDR family oxidoreductase [Streptosporangiales bacterium]
MAQRGDVDLSDRVALVTGGASGIGHACATRLRAAGAHVVVADKDADAAAKVAHAVDGELRLVDLSDLAAVDRLDVEPDVVVNSAGLQHVAAVEDFPPDRFSLILRVMLEAPFRIARRVLPGMYARGWGRLVHLSSVHGLRASAYKSAYVAAKHGVEGLSKTIALEAAGRGVTSNCVDPGYVRTPLVEKQISAQAAQHGIAEDEVLDQVLLARTPIKRLAEPDEVAELVAYLCSSHASFITGASMTLDGGWTAQ